VNNLPEKHNLPLFLQQNKDTCIKIQQYAHENLPQLSIERILEHMHQTIIPEMVRKKPVHCPMMQTMSKRRRNF
jgi:hypothetical protein